MCVCVCVRACSAEDQPPGVTAEDGGVSVCVCVCVCVCVRSAEGQPPGVIAEDGGVSECVCVCVCVYAVQRISPLGS